MTVDVLPARDGAVASSPARHDFCAARLIMPFGGKMVWPRSPLPARGLHRSIGDCTSDFDESEGVEENGSASWTPRSSHTYEAPSATPVATAPKPSFQPSYVYDKREEAHVLQAERRKARLRNCVCCGLCVFAAVFGLVCLGVVLSGSPTPRAQALSVVDRIEMSAMVQFHIIPKPHVVLERYGKRREETADFYGLTSVRGELFPSVSYDRGATHRLSFDGWIHVDTNTSTKYDIVLSKHRGYRIMRSASVQSARSRCATFADLPPLHYLRSSAERAFHAQDWASFRMNCSRIDQAPVEIVFAHIPFVFCPGDLVNNTFSPLLREANNSDSGEESQALWVHGERMLIQIVLVTNKKEAIQARWERTRNEALEVWGNATTTSPSIGKCPYLEAPLSTYTPRSSPVIDDLLRNVPSTQQGLKT